MARVARRTSTLQGMQANHRFRGGWLLAALGYGLRFSTADEQAWDDLEAVDGSLLFAVYWPYLGLTFAIALYRANTHVARLTGGFMCRARRYALIRPEPRPAIMLPPRPANAQVTALHRVLAPYRPRPDAKDVEVAVLRHQLAVLRGKSRGRATGRPIG